MSPQYSRPLPAHPSAQAAAGKLKVDNHKIEHVDLLLSRTGEDRGPPKVDAMLL